MSDMGTAYKVAAVSVRQRFAEQHPEMLDILNRINQSNIAVYSGSFDKVEEVLKYLQVPYTMNPNTENLNAEIIFVNCSTNYDNQLIKDLSQQVENGKYLVSSDWALGRFIAKAFPNTVKPTNNSTKDEVISVEANLNSLWSEVVVLGADPQWWLETSSHPIEILNHEKVQIEAASHDLLKNYNAPIVAVSFDWGKGHVFHVISHFWCKRTRVLTPRHQAPCTDFLEAGMKLSQEGIEKVLRETNIRANTLNFAQIQSAATATELIAQLCIKAIAQLALSH